MKLEELKVAFDIKNFSKAFNKPTINTRVQSQAARKNPAWKKSLVSLMKKYDFALVGAGVNGAVFQNPKYGYVLKVWRTDPVFYEWLDFCRWHQHINMVPKIKGAPIKLNDVFTAIRMEPLLPCEPSVANKFIHEVEQTMDMSWGKRQEVGKENPDLLEVANFLADWAPAYDLTHHNIMKRPNGELVIIDPLYLAPGQSIDDW